MITDTDLYLLAQINSGLRSDMQKLHELDASIQQLIDETKAFPGAASHVACVDGKTVAASLSAIRQHTQLIDESLASDSGDPRKNWKTIMQHGTQVEAALVRLRDSAGATLPADRRQHWNDLWRTIFLQLATIHAQAAMAQARAEMREHYGPAKADGMAQEVLRHLPKNSNLAEATRYAEEYRKAFVEYENNKESFDGFFGIVKALLLIQTETPDSVARRRMGQSGVFNP